MFHRRNKVLKVLTSSHQTGLDDMGMIECGCFFNNLKLFKLLLFYRYNSKEPLLKLEISENTATECPSALSDFALFLANLRLSSSGHVPPCHNGSCCDSACSVTLVLMTHCVMTPLIQSSDAQSFMSTYIAYSRNSF